ncbi:MAG TPA: hypothetical protein VNI02_19415 [Blastocatellia bacterium]|jgi:hypothetical protein|nr:hypothetical protein [Blastocatellia bacterium]
MERDREIVKLINVLRRIARAANYAAFYNTQPNAARFCVSQYNKVLARLTELEPAAAPLFTALPEEASPEVTRMAASELAAFFEDEAESERPRRGARHCGGRRAWAGWASTSGRC